MKVKDLNKQIFDQLVDLECENIIPILKSVGINLNREMMVNELNSFKEDNVVVFERKSLVEGFIVYKKEVDHILIKTFNLKSSNNRKTLIGLLAQIVNELKSSDIDLLVSHCHLTNQKSLNLHRGLGFIEKKKTEKLIEFHARTSEILDSISLKLSRLS
jgi:hypothetical protein